MSEATPGLVRCARCGAGNPAGATWCGQCHARFEASADEAADRAADAPGTDTPGHDAPASVGPSWSMPVVDRDGGEVHWTCPLCQTRNPLDAGTCERCGSTLASFFATRAAEPSRRSSVRVAVALSAVLPGLGHWALGKAGAAVARAILFVWTVGLSVLLLARPPAAGRAAVLAVCVVFLIAAVAIWVVSMLETMRLAEGDDRPMLPRHAFTWLTAGLSVVLMLGLLGAAMGGRASP